MYDEASLHRFGTTLPELDEDTIPAKKPVRPEDQIVTDENGKRRFHGAFTGGFSAGYWNTVGSQEGWTPATFKSSRSEKAAQKLQQCPDDFMDDEDRGEFGIAPERLQTRAEYTTFEPEQSRKRKLMAPTTSGPIPGKPVLEQLIAPRDDKIGERILKSMGWRPGQGIGPRLTRKEKKSARARNRREMYLMQQYGYQPKTSKLQSPGHSDGADSELESSDEEMDKLTFAPDDYEPYVCAAKKDRFGLGYSGSLSRDPVLSATSSRHINLFEPALEALGKNNKKISFKGQAFGVGALEEEDEDIYAKDDMSRYDFSLGDKPNKKKKAITVQDALVLEGFSASETPVQLKTSENPKVPADFTPRNWAERRSRFQPIDRKKAEELETYFKEVESSKKRLNPDQRAELLGEEKRMEKMPSTRADSQEDKNQQNNKKIESKHESRIGGGNDRLTERDKLLNKCLEQENRFTNAGKSQKSDDVFKDLAKNVYDPSKKFDSTSTKFKPFVYDEQKQRRYEEFLAAKLKTEEEITSFLNGIQPIHLSEWDREMEKKEFIQASKIFRPLDGLMSQRFITESNIQAERRKSTESQEVGNRTPKKITIQRTRTMWKPSSQLCKRYNIAEPYGGHMEEAKKPDTSAKISVFDYLEDCVHKKSDFKTPVIVPTKIPQVKPLLKQPSGGMGKEKKPDNGNIPAMPVSTMTSPAPSSCSSSAASTVVKDQPKSSKIGRPAAKTDLEKLSEESMSKPAYEKVELYKAIFDDSSDEEGVEQHEVTKEGDSDCVLEKELINKPVGQHARLYATSNADCVNVLRNTSPPRGIFSALLSTTESSENKKKPTEEKERADPPSASAEVVIDCDAYELSGKKKHAYSHSSAAESSSQIRSMPPSTAGPGSEKRIEFKQPTSSSSRSSLNTASTSSKSLRDSDTEEVYRKKKSAEDEAYGPALPKHIQTPVTLAKTATTTTKTLETTEAKKVNQLIEEKMMRFLVEKAKKSAQSKDEEWVEKKARKLLKTKIISISSSSDSSSSSTTSSSDSDDEDTVGAKRRQHASARKKKSKKKSKSHKKIKKKSKDKKAKKSKKKKNKH